MATLTLAVVTHAACHNIDLVRLARQVRGDDPAYPPPDVPDTDEAMAAWLADDDYHHRWVVEGTSTHGDLRVALGHVGLTDAHPYLTRHLAANPVSAALAPGSVWEISRLFVSPQLRGLGLGARLMEHARAAATHQGKVPALAVLDASVAARALYERLGMRAAGSFTGRHGLNHVYLG